MVPMRAEGWTFGRERRWLIAMRWYEHSSPPELVGVVLGVGADADVPWRPWPTLSVLRRDHPTNRGAVVNIACCGLCLSVHFAAVTA